MNKKEKHSSNKNKNVLVISLLLVITLILIVICGIAYAKYLTTATGSATAEIAEMICTMEVKSSSEDANGNVVTIVNADKKIINPYCIVTVKDYKGASEANPGDITQTDVGYTITVTPKRDANGFETFTMPAYNWYEIASPDATSGTKLATSVPLASSMSSKGTFKNGVAETRYYKIVFLNSGEEDITRYVDFELKAVQAQ